MVAVRGCSNSSGRRFRGSQNVYRDLGLPDAEDMLVKAQLASRLSELISARGYSRSDVAARFGLSLPKLTNIMRGRFRSISVKELEDGVARLGVDGKIVARTRTRSQN